MKCWTHHLTEQPIPPYTRLSLAQCFVILPLLLLPFLLLTYHTTVSPTLYYQWRDKTKPAVSPTKTTTWQMELNNQRLLVKIPQTKNQQMLVVQQPLHPQRNPSYKSPRSVAHLHSYLTDLHRRFGHVDQIHFGVDGAVSHGVVQEVTTMIRQIFLTSTSAREHNKLVVYCLSCS